MAQRLDVHYISYTDGSAAREIAPQQPFKLLTLPRVKKRKKLVVAIDPVAVAGILMSAVLIVAMIVGAVQLTEARTRAAQMEAYVETLRQENEALTAEYENGIDLEHVRATAQALGLVPREQVKHITIRIPVEEAPRQATLWEQICTFLAGLFA